MHIQNRNCEENDTTIDATLYGDYDVKMYAGYPPEESRYKSLEVEINEDAILLKKKEKERKICIQKTITLFISITTMIVIFLFIGFFINHMIHNDFSISN